MSEASHVELPINSAPYWDGRFSGDWVERGGPAQTRFFATILRDALPAWIVNFMEGPKFSILDIGCAFGEAYAVFKDRFPQVSFTGVDISRVSIKRAKRQYPQAQFQVVEPDWSGMPKADFVLASNTLEHLADWEARLTIMCRLARRAAFVLVPYEEEVLEREHVARFDARVFPIRRGTKRLVHLRVIDTRSLPESRWNGRQILAIYAGLSFAGPAVETQPGDLVQGLDLRGMNDQDIVQILMRQKLEDRTARPNQAAMSPQPASHVEQLNAEWAAKFAKAAAEYEDKHNALVAAHAQAIEEVQERLRSTVRDHQAYVRTLIGERDAANAARDMVERRRDFDAEMNAAKIAHLEQVARKELEIQLAMAELTSQKALMRHDMRAEALAADLAKSEALLANRTADLTKASEERAALIAGHAVEINQIRDEQQAISERLRAQAQMSEEARAALVAERDALIASHAAKVSELRAQVQAGEEARRQLINEHNALLATHDSQLKQIEVQLNQAQLARVGLTGEIEELKTVAAHREALFQEQSAQASAERATLISDHALEIDRLRGEQEALAERLRAQAQVSEEARAALVAERDALIASHAAEVSELLAQVQAGEEARRQFINEHNALLATHDAQLKQLEVQLNQAQLARVGLTGEIEELKTVAAHREALFQEQSAQASAERATLISDHALEIARLRGEQEALAERLRAQAQMTDEARAALVAERDALTASHAAKVSELLAQVQAGEEARRQLIDERNTLVLTHDSQLKELMAQLDEGKRARMSMADEIEELKAAILRSEAVSKEQLLNADQLRQMLSEHERLVAFHLNAADELAGEIERLKAAHTHAVSALNALNMEQADALHAAILENERLLSAQAAIDSELQQQFQSMASRIDALMLELAEARRETGQWQQAHHQLLEGHEAEIERLREEQLRAAALALDGHNTQKAQLASLTSFLEAANLRISDLEKLNVELRDHYERHLDQLNVQIDRRVAEAKKLIEQILPDFADAKPATDRQSTGQARVELDNEIRQRISELLTSLEYEQNVAGATDYFGQQSEVEKVLEDAAKAARLPSSAAPSDSFVVAMQLETFDQGGLERVVYDLCCGLQAAGIRVLVLCRSGGLLSDEIGTKGIGVHELRNDDYASILQQNGVTHLFAHHSYYGLDVAANLGIKVFDVVHNTYFWRLKDPEVVRRAAQSSSRVICVSSNVREFHVKAFEVPSSKAIVINNPVNLEGLIVPDLPQLRRIRSTQNHTVFLNVANHYPAKAQIAMISAFARASRSRPEIRLVIAGAPATQSITEEIERLVHGTDLADVVTVLGRCDRRRLGLLYAQSHAFLLPSIFEGYSVSAIEAATYGLPLIMTDVGSAQDLINGNDCGILLPPIISDLMQCTPDLVSMVSTQHENGTTPHLIDAITSIARDRDSWIERGFAGISKAPRLEAVVQSYIKVMQDTYR